MALDIPALLGRVYYRYPSAMFDAVTEHEPGRRLVAVKNVTFNEEFFQGHFPGMPLMPAVLMIESLTQVAAVLVLERTNAPQASRASLRGVDGAKFRRTVVPGDRMRLEVSLVRLRSRLARVRAAAYVADDVVVEADLLLAIEPGPAFVDPSATVHPAARIGVGTTIGPHAIIGPDVRVGRHCTIGASAVIDGRTEIGDETQIFPMASIGLAPQDLKYKGEPTALKIGRRNVFREFVTINRGTAGGGGETTIGDNNLFMAYVHVAHDCHVGSHTIFGPHATMGGHVSVEDFANISAGSAVHQFCRVGRYGFIGGYSVVTKDALPFGRTIGSRPARIFGVNTIGLSRRGFTPDTIAQLRHAYRYLLQSKLNTTRALAQIEQDTSLSTPEVRYLVDFIRSSQRGVILRKPTRRAEELVADE
ncbi:MAG TPA: acyl-ACP--UDP-N-acetylglucosamine O-acyltransferase [Vicinamibacterales bacterium]|nr:acyl-ACP--UDP-N-acetylglucosamine O-acyltransferase [Vicinamibacterales bacterium]